MGTPVELHLPGRAAHHEDTVCTVAARQNVLPQGKKLGFGALPVREAKSKNAFSYQRFNGKEILS